jgi:hypothetical protein
MVQLKEVRTEVVVTVVRHSVELVVLDPVVELVATAQLVELVDQLVALPPTVELDIVVVVVVQT